MSNSSLIDYTKISPNKNYLLLSFNNSMIRYASERFIDVELLLAKQVGLIFSDTISVQTAFFACSDHVICFRIFALVS